VPGMDASFPVAWWTFRKGKGNFDCGYSLSSATEYNCRQMNMDYAACKAANYNVSDGYRTLPVLLIYDIACQWGIHFCERVEKSNLSFGKFRELVLAVGKFHLGVHQKSCLWKYSLNFIIGAGQIDGEIMETLWATFNNFGSMTRSMTRAHRVEILNDHMHDVNHKKMVGMGE
jgi:Kyakuja-Dileera-Zisupton transposase